MTDAGVQRTMPLLKNTEDLLLVCEVLTVSVSSSNSSTSGQRALERRGNGGDCGTTAIEDHRGTVFLNGIGCQVWSEDVRQSMAVPGLSVNMGGMKGRRTEGGREKYRGAMTVRLGVEGGLVRL